MACFYLLNESGFATVEYTLPQYLRQLIKMAKSPSPWQKEAAYLATQGCCLMGTIKSHQRQFHEDVEYCKLAIELATVTGNRLLIASAYTRLGTARFFSDRPEKMLQSYQEAERLIPKVPPFFPPRLQSRIYMGLSNAHACLGHMQDATNYLGMANAIQLFSDNALFIPTLDYDLSNKISVEGIICRKLGEQEEQNNAHAKAKSWYKRASVALAQNLPRGFSERIGVEILNRQGSVAIKLGDKGSFIAYQTKAIMRAKTIRSEKRINEAMINQEDAKKQWSHEKDVLGLDELFDWDPASHASIPSKFTSIQILPGYLFPSPRPLYENAWHGGIFFSSWQSCDRAAL
jgi:tetratricopeptide (TPR) repeat protein